ncbi:MAG: DUF6491 family protein [Sphingomonadaceae bacterium]
MKTLIATALPFIMAASSASAGEPRETGIPFVSKDGIQDFKADGDRGLFIRSINGNWYYARTMGPCSRLQTAITLGFETAGIDELDKNGTIIAQGWRCPLKSVTRTEAPPRKAKKRG